MRRRVRCGFAAASLVVVGAGLLPAVPAGASTDGSSAVGSVDAGASLSVTAEATDVADGDGPSAPPGGPTGDVPPSVGEAPASAPADAPPPAEGEVDDGGAEPPTALAACPTAIELGSVYGCSLAMAETDTFDLVTDGPDQVFVRAIPTTGTHSPVVTVLDGAETVCTIPQLGECSLPGAASYTVEVAADDPGDPGGDYALTVRSILDPVGCEPAAPTAWGAAPTTGSLDEPAEVDCVDLPVATGDVVYPTLSSDSTDGALAVVATIYDADGDDACSFAAFPAACEITGPGPHHALVFALADSAATAAWALNLNRLNDAEGCTALPRRPYGTGAATSGAIDAPAAIDCFAMTTSSAGDAELVRVIGPDGVPSEATLTVLDDAGDTVCTPLVVLLAPCLPGAAGTYYVLVRAVDAMAGFDYSIGRWGVDDTTGCSDMGPLDFGDPAVTGSWDGIARIDCQLFDGEPGDVVRWRVSSTGGDVIGQVLDDDGGQACLLIGVTTCTLSGPTPYRTVVYPFDEVPAAHELRGYRLNDPTGCLPTSVTGLGLAPITGTLDPSGESDCYLLEGFDGDEYALEATNLDGDTAPMVEIRDPNGATPCPSFGSTLSCTLGTTGTHTLVVGPQSLLAAAGPYRVQGACENPACGAEEPAAVAVTPTSAGQGLVTVHVRGRVLGTDDVVRLERAGHDPVVGEALEVSEDGRDLAVSFDLTTATTGTWDVVVDSAVPGVDPVSFVDGFEVVELERPWLDVSISGLDRFIPGRPQTVFLTLRNHGNVDALGAPVIIEGLPTGTTFEPTFDVASYDADADEVATVAYDPDQVLAEAEDGTLVASWLVGRAPAGDSTTLAFRVTVPTQTDYTLRVRTLECFNAYGSPTDPVTGEGLGVDPPVSISVECANALASAVTTAMSAANLIPGGPCVGLAISATQQTLVNASKGAPPWAGMGLLDVISTGLSTVACVTSFIPGGQVAAAVISVAGDVVGGTAAASAISEHCPDEDLEELLRRWATSLDPNAIVGPDGGGAVRATRADDPFTYVILFENIDTATAPAQEVVVTDELDPATFDFTTIDWGLVQWGDDTYEPPIGAEGIDVVVDLRPEVDALLHIESALDEGTGTLTWAFTTLDPATDALPEDPGIGFLPPNVDGTSGQGSVAFTVELEDPTNGDDVENGASITFDLNEPIVTNTWSNLVDADAPTATVDPLPATTEGTTVELDWSGADPTSEVASYDVLVATDGGPFLTWLTTSTLTSATFTGEIGRSYDFVAVARDLAGNVEPGPVAAEASTTLVPEGGQIVCGEAAEDGPFPDVDPLRVFCSDIAWLVAQGVTSGYGDGTYRPSASVGRQEMAAFLFRFADSPDGPSPVCEVAPFTDVPTTSPFCGAITWLVGTGVTTGVGDGRFDPNGEVNRQQMAAFMYRYANPGAPAPTCAEAPFPDVPTTSPFCGYVSWLVTTGVTTGYGDGTFKPTAIVQRDTMAAFLNRLATHLTSVD